MEQQNNQADQAVNSSLTPATTTSTQKSNKGMKIGMIVFSILAFAGVAFGIYGINRANDNSGTNLSSPEPYSTAPSEDNPEDVELTDTYVIRDLNEKIAYLHGTAAGSSDLYNSPLGMDFSTLELYNSGNLSEAAKVSRLIKNAFPDSNFRYIKIDEREAVIKDLGYSGEAAESIRNNLHEGLSGDLVAQKYLDVFGTELNRQSFDKCYYQYNSLYDFYYQNPWNGCGGASPYSRYYYQIKITSAGDYAYVYAAATVATSETNDIYCEVPSSQDLHDGNPAVCATVNDSSDFSLNESNYSKFQTYRFVFKKSDNGTYYFVKVEKV